MPLGERAEIEALDELVSLPRRLATQAEKPTDQDQVLPGGQELVEPGVLARHADPAPHARRVGDDVEAVDVRVVRRSAVRASRARG